MFRPVIPFVTDAFDAIVTMPVDDSGLPLYVIPGVYASRGLALVRRGRQWILAVELEVFRATRFRKQAALEAAPNAEMMLAEMRLHPNFVGKIEGAEFAVGQWYGVAVELEDPRVFVN